ncbi:MAG TPA: DUF3662 domain-containing protein [Anaerolineales bacterium]|nr:DUF3662 domain-containing protein [Anaerolineales bacterium]
MSSLTSFLARLEAGLQTLIEGLAGRLFHSKQSPDALGICLQQALERAAQPPLAPDLYTIVLAPEAAQALADDLAHQDRLRAGLECLAAERGLTLAAPPILRIVPDPAAQQAAAQASFSSNLGETGTVELGGAVGLEPGELHPGVQLLPLSVPDFLIVNGVQTFVVDRPLVTIGRDPGNDLALDDPRVSRQHAQLRLVPVSGSMPRYVIFDLGSTGGTFVNGQPVTQHSLSPGDVISLAGLPIVYGREGETSTEPTQEIDVPPPPETVG